jgi:hypothetical protein
VLALLSEIENFMTSASNGRIKRNRAVGKERGWELARKDRRAVY